MEGKRRACITLVIVPLFVNIRSESFLPCDHRRNASILQQNVWWPKGLPPFLVIHSKLHAQFVPPTLISYYECEEISNYSLGLFALFLQYIAG